MLSYRPEIDGLRSIAVLPVIFFHAGFSGFSGGFVGVDIFFVISGYLITSILIKEISSNTFSIVNFYERRARRILPALSLVLIVCLPFAWFWLLPGQYKDFSQSLVSVSAFSSNILFWVKSGYFDAASELKPLLHTWSLAVEEQYYVFFPLILMFLWHKSKNIAFLSVLLLTFVSFLCAEYNWLNDSSANFYLITSRLWELGIGSIVAFMSPKLDLSRFFREIGGGLGIAAIVYSIIAFSELTPFPGHFTLLPTIGAALVIVCCSSGTLVGRVLSSSILVWIGLISYSLYLWHQPIFAFMRIRNIGHPSLELFLVAIGLAFFCAYISYELVEKPFRNKTRYDRKQVFLLSIMATVFFVVVGLFGSFLKGVPERMSSSILTTLTYENSYSNKTKHCWNKIENRTYLDNDFCLMGSDSSEPSFMLVGDSHAAVLTDPLGQYLNSQNQSGINFSYNTCLPLLNGSFNEVGMSQQACDDFRAWFFSNLDKLPETVIVLSRWALFYHKTRFDNQEGGIEHGKSVYWNLGKINSYKEAILDEYERSIKYLVDAGKKVVLINPVPEAGWVVPLEIAKRKLFGDFEELDLETSFQAYQVRNGEIVHRFEQLNGEENILLIKPSNAFCSEDTNTCKNSEKGIPYYYDDDHLSLVGAERLMALIVDGLQRKQWEP